MSKQTKWETIGTASFANGRVFHVQQAVQRKPAFRAINAADRQPIAHSKHVDAIWRAVRFSGGLSHKYERSERASGWFHALDAA